MNSLQSNEHPGQTGGITILATLMLLILLTIAAIGMSRNSFREVIISGSSRQASMARNAADSGVEFSILWMQSPATLQASTPSSIQLQALASTLLQGQTYGIAHNLDNSLYSGTNTATPPADLQVPAGSGNGFNLSLTAMGKMPVTNQSQTVGSSTAGFTPAAGNVSLTAPDIWALRADGVVTAGSITFSHSKEAWISSPAR